MLHKEHDVISITNARSQNSVNNLVRRALPETLRVSGSKFGKDNRYEVCPESKATSRVGR